MNGGFVSIIRMAMSYSLDVSLRFGCIIMSIENGKTLKLEKINMHSLGRTCLLLVNRMVVRYSLCRRHSQYNPDLFRCHILPTEQIIFRQDPVSIVRPHSELL